MAGSAALVHARAHKRARARRGDGTERIFSGLLFGFGFGFVRRKRGGHAKREFGQNAKRRRARLERALHAALLVLRRRRVRAPPRGGDGDVRRRRRGGGGERRRGAARRRRRAQRGFERGERLQAARLVPFARPASDEFLDDGDEEGLIRRTVGRLRLQDERRLRAHRAQHARRAAPDFPRRVVVAVVRILRSVVLRPVLRTVVVVVAVRVHVVRAVLRAVVVAVQGVVRHELEALQNHLFERRRDRARALLREPLQRSKARLAQRLGSLLARRRRERDDAGQTLRGVFPEARAGGVRHRAQHVHVRRAELVALRRKFLFGNRRFDDVARRRRAARQKPVARGGSEARQTSRRSFPRARPAALGEVLDERRLELASRLRGDAVGRGARGVSDIVVTYGHVGSVFRGGGVQDVQAVPRDVPRRARVLRGVA